MSASTETTPVRGEFTRGPQLVVELDGTCPNPASPKRAKVTGVVGVSFHGNGRAHIGTSGRAHVNDNNRGIEYRGTRFLASNNYERQADGTWTINHEHVSDRDSWSPGGAPKSYAAAITEALAHELAKAWTPEIEREAIRADLLTALYHADEKEAETREAHEKAAQAQQALRDRLAALDA